MRRQVLAAQTGQVPAFQAVAPHSQADSLPAVTETMGQLPSMVVWALEGLAHPLHLVGGEARDVRAQRARVASQLQVLAAAAVAVAVDTALAVKVQTVAQVGQVHRA